MTHLIGKIMTVTTVMSAAAFMGPVASAQTLPQIPEAELNAYPVYSGKDLDSFT